MKKDTKGKKDKEFLQQKFYQLKEQFAKELNSETLRKYKILSEAYKIGKTLDRYYTVMQLSLDFEISYTTTKRIISLDRATPKSWKLIKSGKISSFKVAQICLTKDRTYQDEIVDLVIKQNLSTYDIDKLKLNKDIRTAKLILAVEKGYSRQKTAWAAFKQGIDRMMILLDMNLDKFSEKNAEEYRKKLIKLRDKITEKLGKAR